MNQSIILHKIHKKFTLPASIYSYYSKIASNSESSYLLTENTLHDSTGSDKQISAGNYNIMIQYIHSIRDKAILYRFLKQLDLYRNYLALAQYKTIQSDVIIDYTY